MTPREIQAKELVNGNCSYGCPCQFNALPTRGNCEAIAAFAITRGHFGDVTLDGLDVVATFAWPGTIHETDVDARRATVKVEGLVEMTGKSYAQFARLHLNNHGVVHPS